MKNPFKKKIVHDLEGIQTVTTVTLFGIPIYRNSKKQSVAVSLF